MATTRKAKPVQQVKRSVKKPASTKQETILSLLKGGDGATIADLTKATNWQAHSVRGFISATVKKKLGLTVISERTDGGERRYRIAGEGAAR